MFVNYPINAAQDNNFVHESIYEAITLIFNNLNNGVAVPLWPDVLPPRHRAKLRSRRTIRDLLVELKDIAAPLSEQQRNKALAFIDNQNEINGLLDGTTNLITPDADIELFTDCFERIFLEGFRLLTGTKSRDKHYEDIYESLSSKTCPFCGYEPFEAPGLKREDEDHYLLKDQYIASAANLMNLVPMGGKCNKSYKLQQDILFKNNRRRKALNPYGNTKAEICLLRTPARNLLDEKPDWIITISPDIEETRTWNEVFSIKDRLKDTVLSSNYESVKSEIGAFLSSLGLNSESSKEDILTGLNEYENLKRIAPEQGLGFLKDKVAKMLIEYFEQENPVVIGQVRDSLPKMLEEQLA
ncbi:hypothetical protein [Psychromonas algicola]|uniref:hypothetical protein n=1 Tax=Psychromonas algicola TaxID=2555642 RepID=UPI0010683BFB|nr:hypothetical protein [Psychromonas sp. RZ5]TEW52647.1 hypothetical protein E2R67_01135 [Psychromonas sp. RZ5]